jgi:hypothetical protein
MYCSSLNFSPDNSADHGEEPLQETQANDGSTQRITPHPRDHEFEMKVPSIKSDLRASLSFLNTRTLFYTNTSLDQLAHPKWQKQKANSSPKLPSSSTHQKTILSLLKSSRKAMVFSLPSSFFPLFPPYPSPSGSPTPNQC